MPIYTFPLIYAISITAGLLNYKKFSKNIYLKSFLFFLIYTFFSECLGAYLGLYLKVSNNIVYNTWPIVNFLFLSVLFLSKIKSNGKKTFIKILMVSFSVITLVNVLFYSHYTKELLLNNGILAKFLVVVLVMTYFMDMLVSDEILTIKNSLFFWIAIGVFIYNVTFLPAFALFKYITYKGMFQYITLGLNIIMHTCFIVGFFMSRKELDPYYESI